MVGWICVTHIWLSIPTALQIIEKQCKRSGCSISCHFSLLWGWSNKRWKWLELPLIIAHTHTVVKAREKCGYNSSFQGGWKILVGGGLFLWVCRYGRCCHVQREARVMFLYKAKLFCISSFREWSKPGAAVTHRCILCRAAAPDLFSSVVLMLIAYLYIPTHFKHCF